MKNLIYSFSCFLLLIGYCKTQVCPSSDDESVLRAGYEFTYNYETGAFAEAVGTTNDRSKISINCSISVSHAYDCFYTLQLQNCILNAEGGPTGAEKAWIKDKNFSELSKYSILFSLNNGEINEVYTNEDDPVYFINIKRGALSAFVFKLSSTVKSIDEIHTDVHGRCPQTSQPVELSAGSVETKKDMLYCEFPSRTDWQYSPWSLFWNMSFIQYVINSTTECKYKIKEAEKRIDEVSCKERHAIMLESTHRTTTAVQTNVYYRLSHEKSTIQIKKPDYSTLTRKTDIRFEYERTPDPHSSPENFLPIAKKMLSALILDSVDEIRLFTIPQFTNFVAWIRSSHDLTPLVESIKICSYLPSNVECTTNIKDLAMSYLSDALIQCNSLPCIEAISHLARNGDLSYAYLNFIFYSWSNMHFAKPEILKHIKSICVATDSDMCWMTLGSSASRIYDKNQDFKGEDLRHLKEVATDLRNEIRGSCSGQQSKTFEHICDEEILKYLKAIGNMAKAYIALIPDGFEDLIDVALSSGFPEIVRITALETLKKVNPCQEKENCRRIYQSLVPALLNTALRTTLRISVYDQLIYIPQEYNLEEILVGILKSDKNLELKSYIANSLNYLLDDSEFRIKQKRFVHELKRLLKENELLLDLNAHQPEVKSKFSAPGYFKNFTFMPDELKGFGFKYKISKMYDLNDAIPRQFHNDIFLQAFGKMIHLLESGSYSQGFEGVVITFQKIFKDMDSEKFSVERMYQSLQEVLLGLGQDNSKPREEYNFDEQIIENVRKLEDLYHLHSPKLKPFFLAYLDIFGSSVSYFTSRDVLSLSSKIAKMKNSLYGLHRGVTYNTTRVIRVIEAYHQVPTLMGLPLNWTTNASLAFSIRGGLKMQLNENTFEVQARGFFHPSAALTFLNRMVLDFPTVTQIGVQANSSGYTSTQFEAKLEYSKEKKYFSFKRPSKSQKILELFRTNQLIKHDDYTDIADWNITRKSSSWCTNNMINSLFGLQICLFKSYPVVTHLIKPWALMAGWCKWQFFVNPSDEKLETYDIEILKTPEKNSKELALRFSTPGSDNNREVTFKASFGEPDEEAKAEMKIIAIPDFILEFSKTKFTESDNHVGYRSIAMIKLSKDYKYQLVRLHEDKTEETEGVADRNNSPKSKKQLAATQVRSLTLETPYNKYKFNDEVYRHGESMSVDTVFSYEKLNPKGEWLHAILPDNYWETSSNAWIRMQINWKEPNYFKKSSYRQTVCYVKAPKFTIELDARAIKMTGREQINLNLTKYEPASRKILSFANFTYEMWSLRGKDVHSKEISLYNLTVPLKSWAFHMEQLPEKDKLRSEWILTSAVMRPKTTEKIDYVGWWNEELREAFSIHEHQIKLVTEFVSQDISKEELLAKYSTVTSKDIEGLSDQLFQVNVVLRYPLSSKEESVTLDGYLIVSQGRGAIRFQKNFVLDSSYNNLQLTSHSVLRQESAILSLSHNSFFTHVPSQTKAFNIIEYKISDVPGKCMEAEFKHNIRSHVFDLSTVAIYKCNSNGENMHTLLLNVDTNSSQWEMLNSNLKQIIEDVNPEYTQEHVNFSNPLLTVNVTAETTGKLKDSKKKIVFKCLDYGCNAELSIDTFGRGKRTIKLEIANAEKIQIAYEKKISPDLKNLKVDIAYKDDETDEPEVISLNGQIINKHHHIWKGVINMNAYLKMKSLLTATYNRTSDYVTTISKDPEHPLNKILQPALKSTLFDYVKGLDNESKALIEKGAFGLMGALKTLKPFYEPPLTILRNSLSALSNISRNAYDAVKDKSITMWAIDYFNLPAIFHQSFLNFQDNFMDLFYIILPDDKNLYFKFVTGRIFGLDSFKEWPTLSVDRLYPFESEERQIKPHHQASPGAKLAMIFGPRHIYTFDGHVYDGPEYTSDCVFLLAHDLRKSMFTILSTKENIHVLFPEMTVSVNGENEVFINGSRIPAQLPVQADNQKVTVRRGGIVEIWSPLLTVICSGKDFLCVLELDSWHEGGIFGLLGNTYGKVKNEYTLPNGETTSNLLAFISSYEVSGKPECKNLKLQPKTQTSSSVRNICLNHFSCPCSQNPHVQNLLLDACEADTINGLGACYASSAFYALCYYDGKHVSTKCGGKKQENERIGHNLEVVLVVQEHISMSTPDKKNSVYKGIDRLLTAVNNKFKENGYSNVLFSLVGFGGKGVYYKPSVHTSERNLWLPLRTMVNEGLKTLVFEGKEEADHLNALNYALEVLGYDTFDSKVVIILTKDDKQIRRKGLIDLIQHHLEKNGITLYAISSYPTIEKGKKVFGVRADGLIFPSPKRGGESFMAYPKGELAKITSATRGSLFLSKFLLSNSPASFFDEIAEEIWAKVHKEVQSCRDCSYVTSGWWWKVNECKIVHC